MTQPLKATPVLQTKTVWAGMYGGHYDVIVFFSKKPKKFSLRELKKHYFIKDGNFPNGYYDCLHNDDLIIGDMNLSDFLDLFNVDLSQYLENGRPKDTEIIEVFRLELTTVFDEHGQLPYFHVDW